MNKSLPESSGKDAVLSTSRRLGYPGLIAVFLILLLLCTHPINTISTPKSEELLRLQAGVESLYADVQLANWDQAEEQLQRFGRAAKPAILGAEASDAQLGKAVIRSARAIRAHDQPAALHAANRILEWAECTAHPNEPSEILRFEYLLREIRILLGEIHPKKLATHVGELRQIWEHLKPALEKVGNPAMITDGDSAIRALALADNPGSLTQAQIVCTKLGGRVRATQQNSSHL